MRLIEWNELQVLIRAERIEEMVNKEIVRQKIPVRDLSMHFYDSLLEVTGKSDKLLPIPFRVEIRHIDVEGSDVIVRIDRISAAGLPLPMFLGRLFDKQVAGGKIALEGEGPSIRIRVDRFLPRFIEVTMGEIRIRGEGLAVKLGRGGVDPPEGVI